MYILSQDRMKMIEYAPDCKLTISSKKIISGTLSYIKKEDVVLKGEHDVILEWDNGNEKIKVGTYSDLEKTYNLFKMIRYFDNTLDSHRKILCMPSYYYNDDMPLIVNI